MSELQAIKTMGALNKQLMDATKIVHRKNKEIVDLRRDVRQLRAAADAKAITTDEGIKLTRALPKSVGRLHLSSNVMSPERVMVTYQVR